MSLLRSARVRRLGRATSILLGARLVAGCFSTLPVSSDARPIGSPVVLDITDRGRVDLGNSLGASPLRVEGRLTAATDSSLTVSVTDVEGLRGDHTKWTGESVTLSRNDVGLVSVKRLDKTRTGLAALIAAAAVALVITISLVVSGDGGDGIGGGGTKGPGNDS